MSKEEPLSHDEIEQLLKATAPEEEQSASRPTAQSTSGAEPGEASSAKDAGPAAGWQQRRRHNRHARVRPFDPATQHRVVRERLHTLEIINERFARQFRMSLFNLLRRSADISVESVRYQRFVDFSDNIPVPTNLNIMTMKPLRGTALVVFPQALVSMIVENLFGGDGRFVTRADGREFTGTEQRIIRRVLNLALEAYQDSWRSVYPLDVEYVRSEMQPKFASITSSPSEIVVNTTFHLEVGNLSSQFHICMPYSMIEPLREKLTNLRTDASAADKGWRHRIAAEVKSSTVELVADFLTIDSRIPEIMALKEGDILPVELPESVYARVNGHPVLECGYGSKGDKRALLVKRVIENDESGLTHPIGLQQAEQEAAEETDHEQR